MSDQRVLARPLMMVPWAFLLVLLSVALADGKVRAESPEGHPVLPGETVCPTPLRDRAAPAGPWTEQERWVWQEVCLGRVADLGARYDSRLEESKRYNPLHGTSWSERRVLTSEFLETILLHAPYRTALPRSGVVIVGAWYRERVDLARSRLTSLLILPLSRFEKGAAFDWAIAPEGVSFTKSHFGADAESPALGFVKAKLAFLNLNGSTVTGLLDMGGTEVSSDIDLSAAALEGDVDMAAARIGGDLSAGGVKVNGVLEMESIAIDGDAFLNAPTEVASANMLAGRVGGDFVMDGIVVRGDFGLERLTVGGSVFMADSAKVNIVNFNNASIAGDLTLSDLQSTGLVSLESLSVAGDLFIDGAAQVANVSLFLANIGRDVLMDGIAIKGDLVVRRASTGGDISLQSSPEVASADLSGAKVGGWVRLRGTAFAGPLTMTGAVVAGDLELTAVPKVGAVDLTRTEVGGALYMNESKFADSVLLTGVRVGASLQLQDAEFAEGISLNFARVGTNLVFSGATLNIADLTGVSVGVDLVLGHLEQPVLWTGENPLLVLRNAKVGSLQDLRESWPDDLGLDLGGFSYSRLGGVSHSLAKDEMASRSSDWLVEWLSKDQRYSPQPYEQLASVLRAMGHGAKAKDVLYGGRERARFEGDDPWYSKLWQGLMLVLIGFGYRPYYAVGWILIFVVIGAAVIRRTPEGKRAGIKFGLAYSLDTLLPIIKLRESHYEIDFTGGWRPARYYFYCHQMMGYVLASFLVAGLSGLTK